MTKEKDERLQKILYFLFVSLGIIIGMMGIGVIIDVSGDSLYDDVLDEVCMNITGNIDAKYNSAGGRTHTFECIIGEPKQTKNEVKISVKDYTTMNSQTSILDDVHHKEVDSKTYRSYMTGREWTEYED